MASDKFDLLLRHIEANDREIINFYRLATGFLVASLITHLAFGCYYVLTAQSLDNARVYNFAVFNASALVVELYLSRIAFMLGSRAGQLRDIQYSLKIAQAEIDTTRFEAAARVVMSLRRDVGTLKIMDIESMVNKVAGAKATKDAV